MRMHQVSRFKLQVARFSLLLTAFFMVGFLLIAVNLYAAGDLIVEGNVGIGTTAPNTQVDIAGGIALRAGAFTATNGNNNNINIGGASFIRITGPTAAFTITGISGGVNGKVVILYNAATYQHDNC